MLMKRLLISLFAIAPMFLFGQVDSASVTLQEGTIVKAALTKGINGKDASVGQAVDFILHEDIVLDGKAVVKKGAKIVGTVTEAEASKAMGKKGKLAFSIDFLYMPDGKIIKLRSQVGKNTKSSSGAVVAGAILLSPAALLIKGKNAKFEKGEVFTAYIDKEVKL